MKSEYQKNVAVEQLVTKLSVGDTLSQDQREQILAYSGRGQVWDLSKVSNASELFEFYTPNYIIDLMYDLAIHYGYAGGNILEPSCANGRFLAHEKAKGTKQVGFEINELTAKMAKLVNPKATIHNLFFEQAFLDNTRGRYSKLLPKNRLTWVNEYPFDLVIGNPPYGAHQNFYTNFNYFGRKNYYQVELFFLYAGLMMLRKGGLLVFLTSSNFIRNGNKYNDLKRDIIPIGEMLDAYRMPKVFERSAVPTDIMVWKRK